MGANIKVKKVPLRKCVVTNEQYPKMEMFRIVRTPENEVVIDLGCKKKTAILTAQKKKMLNKHLEIDVPDSVFDELLKLLEEEK